MQNINVLKQKFETGKMPTQADFHELIDLAADGAGGLPVETGTAVEFSADKIYGTFSAPVSGNITHSLTDASNGVTIVIFHSGISEPAYPAEWKKLASAQAYSTTKVNTIYAQHIAGRVQFTITQEA